MLDPLAPHHHHHHPTPPDGSDQIFLARAGKIRPGRPEGEGRPGPGRPEDPKNGPSAMSGVGCSDQKTARVLDKGPDPRASQDRDLV